MAGKPKYLTDEERREARRRNVAKYNASAKRKAAMARYVATGAADEAVKRYRQGPKYRANREKYDTDQFRAWTAIRYATKSGKIVRPKRCEACGSTRRIEAHHYLGYAKEHWLEVRWLCGECHIAAHDKNSAHAA